MTRASPTRVSLTLSDFPDEYGFFYGMATFGEECCAVNVLPPVGLWKGEQFLRNYEPHATAWTIYANGEVVARVDTEEGIAAALLPLLVAERSP